jgi:hypothetical protein
MRKDGGGIAVQRVGVLSELPRVLEDMGLDPGTCLAGTGIDPTALQPDTRVPFAAMLRALARSAEVSGCDHVGLIVGLRFRLEHQGMIGRLMACAPTLRRAFADFVAWQPGYSSGAVVYLMQQGEEVALGYGTHAGPDPGCRPLYDGVMGIGARMVEELTEGRVRPLEVHLSYRVPPDIAPYARLLKAPVLFDQPRTCLVFHADALETRLPGADAERRRRLEAELMAAARAMDPGIAARVRHALRPMIQDGRAEMPAVAAELRLHPRTLRRRLAEEGVRFGDLRDSVR